MNTDESRVSLTSVPYKARPYHFALLAAIAIGTWLNAANLTIAKRIEIETRGQSYPMGSATNWLSNAYPLNNGDYLVVGQVSTNYAWQRFTPTGTLVWSNQVHITRPPFNELLDGQPIAFNELLDGRLAYLISIYNGGLNHNNSVFVIGPDGSGPTHYSLPLPHGVPSSVWENLKYTTLLADTNGVLVGGYGYEDAFTDAYQSGFVMKLSTDFVKVWQRDS